MLIKALRRDEAMNVLCALNEKDAEDPYIVAEFAAIKDSALVMQQGGFRDLFTMDEDRNFHRVVLAYVNQMFQQISGVSKARVQIVVCTSTPTPKPTQLFPH
jgi:predicted site-specific integrase-resolvase